VTQWYSDTLHKHAVTHLGGVQKLWYDANGNMTKRIEGSATYTQTWDYENRLSGVSGAGAATFVYDGDGNRVKATVAGVTTVYVGAYYELSGSTTKKYYSAGGQRVAMQENSTVYFLLGDHLGSTSITASSSGGLSAELRYKAWGESRYTSGATPTTFRFTGQRSEEAALGSLYFYNARWYSPAVGRFLSADTIVPEPGNPQAFNRYSYVTNNPLRYRDPSGHDQDCGMGESKCNRSGSEYACVKGLIPYTCFDTKHLRNFPSPGGQKPFWTEFSRKSATGKD
jgi:RHS repeat-associated protein